MSGLGSVLSMSFFRIYRYLKFYTVNLQEYLDTLLVYLSFYPVLTRISLLEKKKNLKMFVPQFNFVVLLADCAYFGWQLYLLLKCYVLTIHCSKPAIQCCVISGIDWIMLRVTDSSFLSSYDSKVIALNCGNMLRDCIKFPYLQRHSTSSSLFSLSLYFLFSLTVVPLMILLSWFKFVNVLHIYLFISNDCTKRSYLIELQKELNCVIVCLAYLRCLQFMKISKCDHIIITIATITFYDLF